MGRESLDPNSLGWQTSRTMQIELMRWVDQQVGNLLCGALAMARRANVFRDGKLPDSYRKIAVMKFFGIGSIVVASPSLLALREAFPDAKLMFVTFKGNREVVEMLGVTDDNIYIDPSSAKSFAETTFAAIKRLREEGVDLAIDFEFFAKFPLTLATMGGVKYRAGFDLNLEPWRGTLLDIPGVYNHYFHTKDIFLSLVYLLKTGDTFYLDFDRWRENHRYPKVEVDPRETKSVELYLSRHGHGSGRPLIVVNPNAAAELAPELKRWPQERYSMLCDSLAERYPNATILLTGSRGERDFVERIRMGTREPSRVVNSAGELTLRELLALLKKASVFVSNDSGPMHLACLVDVPIVGLFFAETPVLFGPITERAITIAPALYSIPLFTVYTGKNAQKMRNLASEVVTIQEVMAGIDKMIREPQAFEHHSVN